MTQSNDTEDAERYRFLKLVAEKGGLEALVALEQLDFIKEGELDQEIDKLRESYRFKPAGR